MKKLFSCMITICLILAVSTCTLCESFTSYGGVSYSLDDPQFLEFLKSIDKDSNSDLSQDELNAVTYLDFNGAGVHHLYVSKFQKLIDADFSNNPIRHAEASVANISGCLKIQNCESLQEFYSHDFYVHSLDMSGCSNMTSIFIYRQNKTGIASLNTNGCSNLTSLTCRGGSLASLNLSTNTKLDNLSVESNKLKSLDLSKCRDLWRIDVSSNQLTELDVSNQHPWHIKCSQNKLKSLKLGNNSELAELDCRENNLSSIDISGCKKLVDLVQNFPRQEKGNYSYYMDPEDYRYIYLDSKTTVITTPQQQQPQQPGTRPTQPTMISIIDSGFSISLDLVKKCATISTPADVATELKVAATVKSDGTTYKITSIADGAFRAMTKLKKVTIGKNVESIGKDAFNGCKKLKTITIKTTKLNSSNVGENAFKNINKNATVKCPKGMVEAYKKLLIEKGAPKTVKFK